MSWLSTNILPIVATVGGGVLTAFGGGAVGVPLAIGGMSALGMNEANATNRNIASDATNANMAEAARNREFQAQQAAQQQAYQTQMSNTAYQRSVADMTAAGINPMVAATNGGATSPPGAAGSGSQGKAETTKVESSLATALNSAMAMKQMMVDIDQKGSQMTLNNAMATKALQDSKTGAMTAKQIEVQTQATMAQLKAIAAKAKADEATYSYDAQAAKYDAIMSRLNRDSGTAKNVMDTFKMPDFFGGSKKLKPWQGRMKDGTRYDRGTGEIIP